jgi:hypothetical protein
LTNEIVLIIECCKLSPAFEQIENRISEIKNWDDFMSLSYSHGVFPLVYKVLKKYENKIPLDVFIFMKQTYMDLVKTNMLMTSELIKVSNLLEENGIRSIAFKGPTLSQMAYGDVISRQYVDLDLLVDEDELDEVAFILESNKYSMINSSKLLKNKKYLEIDKDFSFFTPNNNIHIEMHWRLFQRNIFKNIVLEDFYLNKNTIIINNNSISTFSFNFLFVYLCLHGSKHIWERIEWIVDINRLLEFNNIIEWNKLIEISEKIDCKISLLLGLNLSKILFDTKYPNNIELLLKDKDIEELTFQSLNFIDKKYLLIENYKKYQIVNFFNLKLISNKKEKFKYFLSIYFNVSKNDFLMFPLPTYLNFLHYFIKPFRVIFKIIFKGK